jgi:aryl-alcohol dehydrogenase-like predicted oxidoreductase
VLFAADAPGKARDAAGAAQVQRRKLGKTGVEVSILGLGLANAFTTPFQKKPEEAAALLERALQRGINYWETARSYGPSEQLIGPVVKRHRDRIFLVCKSTNRTYDGLKRDLETSLKTLQTDHLDLYHIHSLTNKDKDLDAIEKGAVRAALEAKQQGLIKHFGITGHSGAAILIACLKRFKPDAVLTIFPCTRPDSGRYEDELLPLAREQKVGVFAMKTVAQARNTNLKGPDLIRYALSLDGVHAAVVGLDSLAHLNENADMAANFKPLDRIQRQGLHREVMEALAGRPAPWDAPGYVDAVAV